MCGICGVIGFESRAESEAVVRRMMAAMVHRGPDGAGLLSAPGACVGVRRLSIIDLPGGNQPIWNEDGTVAVVFNGEIYNFSELRAELESSGHRFHTRSDTEVIVHAYEEWREECPARLRGMFAFAAVEMPEGGAGPVRRVFLARDPMGIKPLYYATAEGSLLFASELRTLLASGLVSAELSREAVPSYLLFGSVSEPLTLVEGVVSLPPGQCMYVPAASSVPNCEPKPYWSASGIRQGPGPVERPAQEAPASRARSLLEDAVRRHLVADVPVGVFLSSGVDSTAVATLASRIQGGIHTFTVAFPDEAFSEAETARRTAKRLGTAHSEFVLSHQEMLSRLDEAVSALDQPSMDGINTYFVSWAARESGLKVALSGLGSDELFGGYSTFADTARLARLAEMAGKVPEGVRRSAASVVVNKGFFGRWPDSMRKGAAAWINPKSFAHPYFFTRLLFTPQMVDSWCGPPVHWWRDSAWARWLGDAAGEAKSMDSFTAVSWLEMRSYLLSTLLRDTDAMSMSNSLEVRVPFLHLPLVEYVLSLPGAAKHGHAASKALLKGALDGLLPGEIVGAPKRTFTFPWKDWLREPLGKRVAAGLTDWSPALEPYVARGVALGVWEDFLGGRTTWSRPWALYTLNEWAKRNLRAHDNARPVFGKLAATSAL